MTEETAFLTAIAGAPGDDTPRLAFADWLDERGGRAEVALAEFIRLTVDLSGTTFWQDTVLDAGGLHREGTWPAHALCRAHWAAWTELLRQRVGTSPLGRWLGKPDCRWGYRRGFVSVFEGTQQVLLDAWEDLFWLGPIEEVRVNSLWHFGTVSSLQRILDRPSVRVLRLITSELRQDCVDWLQKVSSWLQRLDAVELSAANPDPEAASRLEAWLAANSSLRRVRWRRGW